MVERQLQPIIRRNRCREHAPALPLLQGFDLFRSWWRAPKTRQPLAILSRVSGLAKSGLPTRSPGRPTVTPPQPFSSSLTTMLDRDAVPCGPHCSPASPDPDTRPGQPTPDQQTNGRNISQVKDCQTRRCNRTLMFEHQTTETRVFSSLFPRECYTYILQPSSRNFHSIGAAYVWFEDVLHLILQRKNRIPS